MKLTFLGAAHEVTGSCHYLQACQKNILIDCGMRQGPDEYVEQDIPVSPEKIDYILLTHAHIDHTGRVPLLVKYGFRGEICATDATCDLCGIMLRDSAHIQEFETEWKNRKGRRAGREQIEPLYTMQDAEKAIELLSPCVYGQIEQLCPGISIRFTDVGHLLGSSSIELWVTENGVTNKIVFSGDIGNINQPLINDPALLEEADYVVMESTYGNRMHDAPPDYCVELARVFQQTFDRGGNVVIPSFAVGRTQELLYFIREIKERGLVSGHGDFPVYVDSPLASAATRIFQSNRADCYDEQARELISRGIDPLHFSNLIKTESSDDSRAINFDTSCKVIISASGMCEAGRIKHHLKHNLWRPESTVLFVGYQAFGTLGRSLVEGAKSVKLFGETIDVKAHVCQLEGISGHADQQGLMNWLGAFSPPPRRVFVVHGEDSVCEAFAQTVRDTMKLEALAPNPGESWQLAPDVQLNAGTERKLLAKREKAVSGVFGRLLAAGRRVMEIIENNRGGANKDLARFADQLNSLCDKWER